MEPPNEMAIDVREILRVHGKAIHKFESLQDAIDHEMGRLQGVGFFDRKQPKKTPAFLEKFGNNSGFKLEGMIMKNKVLPKTCEKILDLCGAPGGFCRVLSRVRPDAKILTLSSFCGDCTYKPSNVASGHVTVVCSDRLGDIMTDKTWNRANQFGGKKGFDLIVADGSCASFNRWSSQERDNCALLERELRYVFLMSAVGANAVVKVFYGWHPATCALFCAFTLMFDHVQVVKPEGSSPLSGECYWIGHKFLSDKDRGSEYDPDHVVIRAYLKRLRWTMRAQLDALKAAH